MLTIDFNGHATSFDLITVVWWVVIGLIAGLLASTLTGRRGGALSDIILGILGAFVGGFVFSILGLGTLNILGTILSATLGAVLIILLLRVFSYSGRRRRRL